MSFQFFRGASIVTAKNIRIYYNKAPVLIFGLLFPFFMFLSFFLGRDFDLFSFFPGFLAMSIFFTSSSIGPLITPWEKQAGTYERLISFPVNITSIIMGDIFAGMIFGLGINVAVLGFGIIFIKYSVHVATLILALLISSFCFSSLGVLFASYPGRAPSNVMMLSSLVRFPLIFISGIFIPLENMKGVGKFAAFVSPITYMVDIFKYSLCVDYNIFPVIDFSALIVTSLLFIIFSVKLHKKNLIKGL